MGIVTQVCSDSNRYVVPAEDSIMKMEDFRGLQPNDSVWVRGRLSGARNNWYEGVVVDAGLENVYAAPAVCVRVLEKDLQKIETGEPVEGFSWDHLAFPVTRHSDLAYIAKREISK